MAFKGKALLVGLCSVDPILYNGWDGVAGCWGCEIDVDNIEGILTPLSYDIETLKTANATKENILDGLNDAASELKSGDIFVYYFSGHGGQQPDQNGDDMDGQDETQCAYNGQLIDDQLNEVWLKFKSGVRIVMMSDSCNSGTVYKNLRGKATLRAVRPTPIIPITDLEVSLAMKAKLIHLGGCRDGFGSSGYQLGGAFTIALCNAWNNGNFQGNYPDFHQAICAQISSSQQPQYAQYGSDLLAFRNQRPFTILPPVVVIEPPPWEYEFIIPDWILQLLHEWTLNPKISNAKTAMQMGDTKENKVIVRMRPR